jgi:hypothetical protein
LLFLVIFVFFSCTLFLHLELGPAHHLYIISLL